MKKILVAYDGGEPARRALDLAADLADGFGAKVGIVSVIPYHPGRSPIDPWDDRPVHTAQLAEAEAHLAARGITATCHEPAGDPARAIEEVTELHGYDTVALVRDVSAPLDASSRAAFQSMSQPTRRQPW